MLKNTRTITRFFVWALVLWLGTTACSTKKNTWMSRAYHNVNSEFNVKFNANESFKAGVKKADDYLPQEYDQMPPVFAYEYKEIPGKISGEMDRTIEKCEKLVLKHSITAKPKKPSGQMSREQREFYNQTEFNSVVDDAYLLNGKANMYLHQYDKAIVIFDYILTEYPKSSAVPETKIQLAGALIRTNESDRAQQLLSELNKDDKLAKSLRPLLDAAYADLYIQQKKYNEAVKYLEQALKQESKKSTKIRYYFILSELYGQTGRNDQAISYLNKAIRLNPPYSAVFAAQMRKAALYDPKTQGSQLKEDLLGMLKDEKNSEYADQIYFALAQVEKASKNDTAAVNYLKQSVAVEPPSNEHQKALAYVMLGDYDYALRQYTGSYANYENALQLMDASSTQYDTLERKADGLKKLAENYRIVQREDSLQRIAAMPAAEREKWITAMIAQVTAQEERDRQEQRQQQYFMYQQDRSTLSSSGGQSGAWYFYNTAAVNSGVSSFNMRWGRRRLEDDWRRRNKREITAFTTQSDTENATEGEKPLSNKSREYYTKELPLTPVLLAVSNERLSGALFHLGEAYKDDVHEPQAAINTFRTLDKRFPQGDNQASILYYLYELYTDTHKPDSAEYYKNQLIVKYPKGPLAQQLTNPNYYAEQQAEKSAMEMRYEQVFEAYDALRYAEAGRLAAQMMEQFPNSLLQPQLEFIHAVSVGAEGDIAAYKNALSTVSKQYPTSDAALAAKEMIVSLEKQELQYTSVENDTSLFAPVVSPTVATEYIYADSVQYVGLICVQAQNTAELLFTLESYNADVYLDKNLEVFIRNIGESYSIVLVGAFPSILAAEEYLSNTGKTIVLANYSQQEYRRIIITPENLEVLLQSKDVAAYLNFFTGNYFRK